MPSRSSTPSWPWPSISRPGGPKLGNVFGGLSGPAIKPIALRMICQVARAVRIPVIGMGGIMSGADALEFMIAGARAVQVGTANFVEPAAALRIVEEMGPGATRTASPAYPTSSGRSRRNPDRVGSEFVKIPPNFIMSAPSFRPRRPFMTYAMEPAHRIITALDVETKAQALALVRELDQAILFKVGLELFTAEGPALLQEIKALGKGVFLDLKLHDIPNTVGEAARIGVRHGARMMTIHTSGGAEMMARAAVTAARNRLRWESPSPSFSASPFLTSLKNDDLKSIGMTPDTSAQVLRLAALAKASGMDGVVCFGPRDRDCTEGSGAGFSDRDAGHPPRLVGGPGSETDHDAGFGGRERIGLPRRGETDHAGSLPPRSVSKNRRRIKGLRRLHRRRWRPGLSR